MRGLKNQITDALDRFLITETCWLWVDSKDMDGYGRFWFEKKWYRAHRLVFKLVRGYELPSDLEPDHLCRVRHCVNPSHIEPVTVKVNLLRGDTAAAHNAAKTHCLRGHPFTEENTLIKKLQNGGSGRSCRTCHRMRMQLDRDNHTEEYRQYWKNWRAQRKQK